MSDYSHIETITTWKSGGGIDIDVVDIADGPTLAISEGIVAFYDSPASFWAEVEDGDEGHRLSIIDRATGHEIERPTNIRGV